jgi:hypothetical protein
VADEPRVDFAKYKAIWDRATARMKADPDRVAASGPEASVEVVKDRYFKATAREFTFYMDEPLMRGGTNRAAAPMEYFVAGAAG